MSSTANSSKEQRERAGAVRSKWRAHEAAADARKFLDENSDQDWDRSIMLSLVYEAYCVRRESGEEVDEDSYAADFPELGQSLPRLIQVDGLIRSAETNGSSQSVDVWPEIGDIVADFEITEELGRGAFARAYLASETTLRGRPVVVKVVQDSSAEKASEEAGALARLPHPNIVPVNSAKSDPLIGCTAICMPYYGRTTLREVIDRLFGGGDAPRKASRILEVVWSVNNDESITPRTKQPERIVRNGEFVDAVLWIGSQLSDALACAHNRGIYHGDIKPANVLVDPHGQPLLFDFNLAQSGDSVSGLGGTIPYMSPEHLAVLCRREIPDDSKNSAARADIFALGVTIYELLCGRLPFDTKGCREAENPAALLLERQQQGPRRMTTRHGDVDPLIVTLIESCIAFDPQDRPGSCEDIASAFQRLLTPLQRARRWARKNPVRVVGAAVLVLSSVTGTAAYFVTRPPYAERLYRDAMTLIEDGNFEDARQVLSDALSHDTSHVAARSARGDVHAVLAAAALDGGDFGETLRLADLAIDDGNQNAEMDSIINVAAIELAEQSLASGKEFNALKAANRALKVAPQSAQEHELRGLACIELAENTSDREIAKRYLNDAFESFGVAEKLKSSSRVSAYRAYCGLELGFEQVAIENYQQALAQGAQSAAIWNNLGVAFLLQGRLKEAIAGFTEAVALDDTLKSLRWNRAVAFWRQSITDNEPVPRLALDDIEIALTIKPVTRQVCRDAVRIQSRSDVVDRVEIEPLVRYMRLAVKAGCAVEEFDSLLLKPVDGTSETLLHRLSGHIDLEALKTHSPANGKPDPVPRRTISHQRYFEK